MAKVASLNQTLHLPQLSLPGADNTSLPHVFYRDGNNGQTLDHSSSIQRSMATTIMGPVTGPSKEEALDGRFDEVYCEGNEFLQIQGESCFEYDATVRMDESMLKQQARTATEPPLPPLYEIGIRPVTNIHPLPPPPPPPPHGTIQTNRLSHPHTTMLPLIRSGIHLPTPPTPSTITRTGIYPLIDRGFMPPSADFTPLLAPIDLSHWNVSLSIPPSTVRPFLRHFKKKLHDVGWRNIRPDLQTPVTGLYRPALHLIDPPHNPPPQIASAHSTPHIPQPRSPPPTASSRQPLHQSSEQLTFSQSFTDLSAPPDESCVPTVPIKDGRVMVESPGYCYLRERAGERWEKVRWVLEKVEEFVRNWDVGITSIRWDTLERLASQPLPPKLDNEALLSCFANANAIRQILAIPGQRYKGEGGQEAAALKIQATWRMSVRRRIHLWYLDRLWAAQIFARRWKIKKVRRRLAQIMEAQYQNVHLKRYNRILTTYKRDEGQIMAHRRVIVMLLPSRHPGSLDPFPDVGVGRTFLLADPTVDLVFVTPLLDEERINYFRHMMSTTFPTSNPLTSPIRLRFIIPEAARCFKENSSLASMVVASRRAVREIRKMCKGRNAILCGVDRVEMAEVELSSIVNIPLYAPAPNAYSTYLSSRSATRALLKEAGCPLLPCIVSQAETEDDFVADVVSAVLGNREASVWMLWGEGSKGVDVPDACLDPTSPHISHLFQSSRPTTPLAQPSPVSRPKTPFTEHLKKAKHSLPSAIRLLHPMAPRTWKGFVSKWCEMGGGCIVGFPKGDMKDVRRIEVGIEVEFGGGWRILGSCEGFLTRTMITAALLVPHQRPPVKTLYPLLENIAKTLHKNSCAGYFTIEFYSFFDSKTNTTSIYPTHIHLSLSPCLGRALTVTLSTGCKFDGKDMTMRFIRPELPAGMKHFDNAKFVDMTKARKTFHNVKLPTIDPIENRVACYVFGAEHHLVTDHGRRVLFGCAIKGGEVFDEWSRLGVIFPTLDVTRRGSVPFITVSRTAEAAVEDALKMLMKLNWQIDYKGVARTDENAVAANNFMPIATRLLSEHLLFHPQATRPNLPDPLMMTFPVQKALQDLGLIPKSSTPSIPNSRLQTAQTTSRPTSRLQPYQPTRPLTAQTPSLSTDLESLLQPFISLPPATLYSTPIPSKPAGPTFQISAETQEILLQGIPSMHAASHDSTFRRPVISPPYSRRASAERAKKSEGRNKRARTLLAKMEEEFERGRPVGSRKGKKPKVTIAVAENDLETSKPIKKEQSIGTRVKAAIEAVKAEAEELEASEKKIEKLGLGERRPFVDEPRASVLDDRTDFEISKALMRLQEVRSGEEELGVGERIEEARRAVEERHRRVLEDVERKGVGGGGIGGTQVTEDTPKNREIMRQLSVPAVLPERGRRLADIMGGGADRNWDRVGAVGGVGGGMSRRGSRRPSQIEERRISALASEAIGALLDDMQEEV